MTKRYGLGERCSQQTRQPFEHRRTPLSPNRSAENVVELLQGQGLIVMELVPSRTRLVAGCQPVVVLAERPA